jgi:hypothetical protein
LIPGRELILEQLIIEVPFDVGIARRASGGFTIFLVGSGVAGVKIPPVENHLLHGLNHRGPRHAIVDTRASRHTVKVSICGCLVIIDLLDVEDTAEP